MIEIYVLATLALRTAKVHFLVPDVRVWQGSCLLQGSQDNKEEDEDDEEPTTG